MLLQLLALLILCAAVRGKEVECDQVHYDYNCWTSENNYFNYCGICVINNQEVSNSDEVLLISNTHENGTVADVEFVRFHGGEIAKMSKIIHKTNSKQILQVQLWETKTQVLNEQFFGNAAENLTQFKSLENNLSVKDFAFQNCKNLEHLDLSHNKITSIAPNAFRGLQKLIQLNLSANELSSMLNGWFYELGNLEVLDLGANQLEEIPKNSFNSLIRLKELFLFTNRIEIISKNLFKHNEQLQTINLWDNKIKQIQSGSFAHLNQLTELTLGRNECTNQKFIHKTPEEIAKGLTACYPKTESACVIPQISNGHIVSIDDNLTQVPGDFFESTGSVKVVCNSSFIQIHDKANQTTNRCVKDKWEDFQWPTCHSRNYLVFKRFLLTFIPQDCVPAKKSPTQASQRSAIATVKTFLVLATCCPAPEPSFAARLVSETRKVLSILK